MSQFQPPVSPTPKRFVVLIANTKGGCGKTTLTTNLTSYYASHQQSVSLLDLDPQQSSLWWLKHRPSDAAKIHPLALSDSASMSSTLLQQGVDKAQGHLVIDCPAGLESQSLNQLLRISQVVLIPVLPSAIDIHAVTRFLQTLMLTPSYRQRPRRLAVVANRARVNTRSYANLERFLSSLKIPFLVTLRDTQLYTQAFEAGLGIHELPGAAEGPDIAQWKIIAEWLEVQKLLAQSGLPV
jgi:chromosome partitioning protein